MARQWETAVWLHQYAALCLFLREAHSPLPPVHSACSLDAPAPVSLPRCQVEDLARLSFKRKPLYVGIDDSKAVATREGLEQVGAGGRGAGPSQPFLLFGDSMSQQAACRVAL